MVGFVTYLPPMCIIKVLYHMLTVYSSCHMFNFSKIIDDTKLLALDLICSKVKYVIRVRRIVVASVVVI